MNQETIDSVTTTTEDATLIPETAKLKRDTRCSVVIAIDEVSENEYSPVVLFMEEWSEPSEATEVSFGSTSGSDETFYLFRDETMSIVPKDSKSLVSLLGGLDAWHESKRTKAIDYILDTITSEKNKEAARNTMLNCIGKLKQESIIDDVDELYGQDALEQINGEIKRFTKIVTGTSAASSAGLSNELLSAYAFNKNILLTGEAGSGKTFSLSQWADQSLADGSIDCYYQMDCNEAVESIDMLGMQVPNSDGTLTWVDGPVTEAFRCASAGKKTVLFIDEILRTPQRDLSLLIGSLAPKADGYLYLRTGRVVSTCEETGVGQTEQIKCLPSDLWVTAASNVGVGFDTNSIDPAFQDRFRTFRVDSAEALVKLITSQAATAGVIQKRAASKLVELFNDFQAGKKAGNLQKVLSARHISEVIALHKTGYPLHSALEDLSYTVLSINSTGIINTHEADIYESLIAPFA